MSTFIEIKLTHIKNGEVMLVREQIIYPFWSTAEQVMEDIMQVMND